MDKKSGKINEMDKKSPFSDGMKIRFRRKKRKRKVCGKKRTEQGGHIRILTTFAQ